MKRRISLPYLTAFALLGSLLFLVNDGRGGDGVPAPAKPQSGSATHLLRYKFQPGETIRHDVSHRATSETTVAGVTQTTQTVTNSVKVWKVLDVSPKGDITFEHSVDSLKMKTRISGHSEIVWDSSSGEKPPAGYEDAAKSIGVPLVEVTIDSLGKTIKREEKTAQKVSDGKGSQIVIPLPEEQIAVGAEWNVPFELDLVGEGNIPKRTKMRQHFELKKVHDNIAEIAVETQVLTPTENPKFRAQLAQKLSRGTIRFDIKTGRVVRQEVRWDERVIGFSGAESSLKFVAVFEEKISGEQTRTAEISKPPAKSVEK